MVFAAAFCGPDVAVVLITDNTAGITAGQRAARAEVWSAWQGGRCRRIICPVVQITRQNKLAGRIAQRIVVDAGFRGPHKQLPGPAIGVVDIAAVRRRI